MITCAALAIGLHIGTYHSEPLADPKFDAISPGVVPFKVAGTRPRLKAFNPGLYAICDSAVVGAYRNSLGRASVYGAYSLPVGPFDVALGGVTGYDKPVIPLVVPSLRVGHVRLSLLLPYEKGAAALHFSLEF